MEQVFIVTRTTDNKFGLVPYPEESNVILKAFKYLPDAQDFITNMSSWNKFAMAEQLDDIWYDINAQNGTGNQKRAKQNQERKRLKNQP